MKLVPLVVIGFFAIALVPPHAHGKDSLDGYCLGTYATEAGERGDTVAVIEGNTAQYVAWDRTRMFFWEATLDVSGDGMKVEGAGVPRRDFYSFGPNDTLVGFFNSQGILGSITLTRTEPSTDPSAFTGTWKWFHRKGIGTLTVDEDLKGSYTFSTIFESDFRGQLDGTNALTIPLDNGSVFKNMRVVDTFLIGQFYSNPIKQTHPIALKWAGD